MNRNRSAVIGLLVAVVSLSMMSNVQAQWGAYGNHIYNTNSGNVGIGTMNPEAKLDVRGGGILTYSSVGPSYLDITSDYSDAFLLLRKTPGAQAFLRYQSGASIKIKTGLIYTDDYSIGDGVGNIWLTVKQNTGNVGIGTTNPAQKLSVAGTIESTSGGFKFPDGTVQTTAGGGGGGGTSQWTTSSSDIYYNSGKVGIGTTTPAKKLHVSGSGTNITLGTGGTHPSNAALRIASTSNVYSEIIFAPYEGYFGDNLTLKGSGYGLAIQKVHPSVSAALNIGFSDANYGDGLFVNGKVGIGTTTTGSYLMAVNGTIRTKEVVVSTQGWPDFVFDPSYQLSPIADLEQFIEANKRLPGMPSAQQVEKEGLEIGVMQSKLLQKIEELTLYLIELKKENELMKTEITALKEK